MWSVHYDLSIDTARADALFASALQISDAPSAVQVKQAIDAATRTLGDLGCVARVAQEFGELDPRGDLVGCRLLGQLGRAHAQLVYHGAVIVAKDGI